jgi:ATP-dependent protease ClpP protease subunit
VDEEKTEQNTKLVYNFPSVVNRFVINLDHIIEGPDKYRDVFDILFKAERDDIIIFNINTNGGDANTTVQFHNMIQQCAGYSKAVVYNACSAGSIIAFSCDEIIIQDFSTIMVHSSHLGTEGKTGDVKNCADHFDKETREFFGLIYKGFLSEKEIDNAIMGKDLWFGAEESRKRLRRWKAIGMRER